MNTELLDDHLFEIEEEQPSLLPEIKIKRIIAIIFEYFIAIIPLAILTALFGSNDVLVVVLLSIFLINKDAIGGKSFVKRLAQTKLIDTQTGKAPHPIRSALRNFSVLLGIVEVIVFLVSPEGKRVGDYLCRTRVVRDDDPKYKTSFQQDLKEVNWGHVILSHAIFILPFFVFYAFI